MSPRSRMTAEDRRRSILAAAIPLFAARGFDGTTTKMIARGAKVSEALLYRHFPSKDSIYQELRDYVCNQKDEVLGYMQALPSNTQTLVFFTHFLLHHIYLGDDSGHPPGLTQEHMNRLLVNSYLEDGAFARMFLSHTLKLWKPFLLKCIETAVSAGHMRSDSIAPVQKLWFVHHLAVALSMFDLPKEPVIHYEGAKEEVARNAVVFALRGMGLREEIIEEIYQPEVFPDLHVILQERES